MAQSKTANPGVAAWARETAKARTERHIRCKTCRSTKAAKLLSEVLEELTKERIRVSLEDIVAFVNKRTGATLPVSGVRNHLRAHIRITWKKYQEAA